jgi:hypothetical protein
MAETTVQFHAASEKGSVERRALQSCLSFLRRPTQLTKITGNQVTLPKESIIVDVKTYRKLSGSDKAKPMLRLPFNDDLKAELAKLDFTPAETANRSRN